MLVTVIVMVATGILIVSVVIFQVIKLFQSEISGHGDATNGLMIMS